MDALVKDLEEKLAAARQGGGPRAAERMRSKGKKLPRERYVFVTFLVRRALIRYHCSCYVTPPSPHPRLSLLLDKHTPFLELSALAAHEVYPESIPGAGIITGIGRIAGRECVIVVNDATVKGGSYYPLTVRIRLII